MTPLAQSSARGASDMLTFGEKVRFDFLFAARPEADPFFMCPANLREYQVGYRRASLHGGVPPEEMILPVALLTPRAGV
jgi:hypothetical protein